MRTHELHTAIDPNTTVDTEKEYYGSVVPVIHRLNRSIIPIRQVWQ